MRLNGIRRLCVGVDVHQYSRRGTPGQHATQERMIAVLREASGRAGLRDHVDLQTQDSGDGQLALLPPGINEPEVIADLVRHVRIALFQLNRDLAAQARLRLRMAMHQGLTYLADAGYAGDTVIHLARLLDAAPLRQAMVEHEHADLGLIVADHLYDEVIRHDPADLRAADFQRVEVSHPGKGFRSTGWIFLPDRRPPGDPATPAAASPTPDRETRPQYTRVHQTVTGDHSSVTGIGNVYNDGRG